MKRVVNIIPMAGAGQRFADAGYSTPKPLIEVNGLPMIVRAAQSLPNADHWIFICRKEHIICSDIQNILEKHFPQCSIITVEELTEGQACTVLLARSLLRKDDRINIGACDNAMTWNAQKLSDIENSDFLTWTFRNNPAVKINPKMYGWVKTDESLNISEVSVKQPISDNPMKDHAIVGAFSFKEAGLFLEATDYMIKENSRINNEFYIDNVINFCIKMGAKGKAFEVDKYICWGTPNDLATYNYWLSYFKDLI